MIQGTFADKVRKYHVDPKTVKKDPQKVIKQAKDFAKWYNRALDRAIKGGVPKKYLPKRGAKINVRAIKGIKSAERAIAKAKMGAWSNTMSPRDYKNLIKQAEAIYGKRKFKLIQDPTRQGRVVAVPVGSQGTSATGGGKTVRDIESEYWDWYWGKGQYYIDSDQAALLFDEAMELNVDPIEHAKEYIRKSNEEQWQDYVENYGTEDEKSEWL